MSPVTSKIRHRFAVSAVLKTGTGGMRDEASTKSIILVNSLGQILGCLVLLTGIIFYFFTHQLLILLPALLDAAIAFSVLWLNHLRKHTAAALTIFLLQCASVLYFGLVLGEILVLQLMIIFLIAITYLLFNKPALRWFCVCCAIVTLIILEAHFFYNPDVPIQLDHTSRYLFKWISMAGLLVLIIFTGRHYVRSSDFKRVFLYQITHELRTPLNAILVATQLIKRELKHKPDLQNIGSLSDHLLSAGTSARNIINNVLDMAQIESGKLEKREDKAFLVQPFFEQIISIHHVIAQYRDIVLRLKITLMPEVITGDPLKLNVVLTNLLSNAIKYADKNTEVLVDISGAGDLWQLQVSNAGEAIPLEKQDIIFDPFVTHKSKHVEGTGLGLFITRIKVASMGGNINVTSLPGDYTTFTVTLPLQEGKLSDVKKEHTPEGTQQFFNIHVLIADDNDMNNILLSKYLKQLGCSVTMTVNGLEAIRQAELQTPDVVILDYHMPVMDGKEALLHFKNKNSLKHIPVIMATGDAFKGSEQILMDAGADAFLEKPISFNKLHNILHECLKK